MRSALTLYLVGLTGCAADLGASAAVELPTRHPVYYGRAALSTRAGDPLNTDGLLLGASIESRGEPKQGTTFLVGGMVGYGSGPPVFGPRRFGCETYVEIGTPIRSPLFEHLDSYLGATLALPIRVMPSRDVRELNEHSFVVYRRLEVVPGIRVRSYFDDPLRDVTMRTEVMFSLTGRFRLFSDFL